MSIQSITEIRAETPTITLSGNDLVIVDQALKTIAATLTELKAFVRPAVATGSVDGLFTGEEKTKLAAIASQATRNQTDAYLLSRGNHSGTQPIASITGLQDALNAKVDDGETFDITDITGLVAALSAITSDVATLSDDLTTLDGVVSGHTSQIATKLPIANPAPTGAFRIPLYTLTTLPDATTNENYLIFVTNATAGRTLCYSDGTDWKINGTTTTVS